MRCKNCGTNNDDGRYICETCGSPLYDEEQLGTKTASSADTATFAPLSDNRDTQQDRTDKKEKMDDKTKKSIILIVVLAVLLMGIITWVVVAANSGNKETTTAESSASLSDTTENTTTRRTTTRATTTRATTTTTTTTSTTTSTTKATTTTTVKYYNVSIDSSGYGSVSGNRDYKKGESAELIAVPDEGYVFEGWYENGARVDGSTRYVFTVKSDRTLKAVFAPAPAIAD